MRVQLNQHGRIQWECKPLGNWNSSNLRLFARQLEIPILSLCIVITVSGCLDVSKSGSTYIGWHVHPKCTSSAGATYMQTCRGPQQTLLLVKTFVLVPVESFRIGGELKCTWRRPKKKNTMYVEPGPAEQDNFFKVCPGNQKPWLLWPCLLLFPFFFSWNHGGQFLICTRFYIPKKCVWRNVCTKATKLTDCLWFTHNYQKILRFVGCVRHRSDAHLEMVFENVWKCGYYWVCVWPCGWGVQPICPCLGDSKSNSWNHGSLFEPMCGFQSLCVAIWTHVWLLEHMCGLSVLNCMCCF
jgi:hypothetical protein